MRWDFLPRNVFEEEIERIRRHEKTSRPWGHQGIIERLEEVWSRILQRQKTE